MTVKDTLHRIIDELPESELPEAERALRELLKRGPSALPRVLANAPGDDEPETEEERVVAQKAREDLAAGRVVPHDEALRRLLRRV